MRKIYRGFLSISGFAALLLGAGPSIGLADHSWGNYHWERSSAPFHLELGDNLTSNWDSYLGYCQFNSGLADWAA